MSNKIVLASSSPRRKFILSMFGLDFKIVPCDSIKEFEPRFSFYPSLIVKANAVLKANCVSSKYRNAFVLASDTLVFLDGKIFGKPKSREDAFSMLKKLSGKSHLVFTFVVLMRNGIIKFSKIYKTEVSFFPLSQTIINNYLFKANYKDKAGAYAIQEHGAIFVQSIKGSYTNVIGLPVEALFEVRELVK